MEPDRLREIEQRARRVLGEDAVTAPARLWHPWALDLADDALALLALLRLREQALGVAAALVADPAAEETG